MKITVMHYQAVQDPTSEEPRLVMVATPRVMESESLKEAQALVGGLIERISFGPYEIWVNEEGRLMDNYYTIWAGIEIAGPFFVCRADMTSLTESDVLLFDR